MVDLLKWSCCRCSTSASVVLKWLVDALDPTVANNFSCLCVSFRKHVGMGRVVVNPCHSSTRVIHGTLLGYRVSTVIDSQAYVYIFVNICTSVYVYMHAHICPWMGVFRKRPNSFVFVQKDPEHPHFPLLTINYPAKQTEYTVTTLEIQ